MVFLLLIACTILKLNYLSSAEEEEVNIEKPYMLIAESEYEPVDFFLDSFLTENQSEYYDSPDVVWTSVEITDDVERKKRSAPQASIQSSIIKFYKSSKLFKETLDKLMSSDSKDNFIEVMQNVTSLITFALRDEKLSRRFTQTLESIFDKLSPELLLSTFADALEELLTANNKLTAGNITHVLKSLDIALKEGEELLSSNSDGTAFGEALGFTVYSFLVDQEISSLESFRSWFKFLISKLDSLKEGSSTLPPDVTTTSADFLLITKQIETSTYATTTAETTETSVTATVLGTSTASTVSTAPLSIATESSASGTTIGTTSQPKEQNTLKA